MHRYGKNASQDTSNAMRLKSETETAGEIAFATMRKPRTDVRGVVAVAWCVKAALQMFLSAVFLFLLVARDNRNAEETQYRSDDNASHKNG